MRVGRLLTEASGLAASRASVIVFAMSRPRTFPDARFVERNPRIDVDVLWRGGALQAGGISRWACHWLVVTIEASSDWITIDGDQRIAIEREEILNGRHSRVKFRCPGCNRGCRVLHAQGHGFVGCVVGTTTWRSIEIAGRPA